MTRGHAAGCGKARLGHDDAALGHAPGTPRRKAAALRQAAEVGRAAGDRVYIAVARLTMHGRGQEAGGVGVFRCAQDLGNRSALDNTAGIHDRARIGDLGSDPRS